MRHRRQAWLAVFAALGLASGALAVHEAGDPAAPDYGPRTETLVEGHTVFAVIQATQCVKSAPDGSDTPVPCPEDGVLGFNGTGVEIRAGVTIQRMGAAVAVLVRDRVKEVSPSPLPTTCGSNKDLVTTLFHENPGVLWFNDQFLVGDDLDLVEVDADANVDVCRREVDQSVEFGAQPYLHPCGGWILATQAGNPDPRAFPALAWSYVESYRIIDPNDRVWLVHKFTYAPQAVGIAVPPLASADSEQLPDGSYFSWSATSQGTYVFLSGYDVWVVPVFDGVGLGAEDAGAASGRDCGPHVDGADGDPDYNTHDPGPSPIVTGSTTPAVRYNAVVFFFFEDLRVRGLKTHGAGAPDDRDVSYCQAGTEWDCGTTTAGSVVVPRSDDEEGNSHPYNLSADSGPVHLHPTASVDLYYSNKDAEVPDPPADLNYAVFDTVGSSAPRHAHGGEPFDDRSRLGFTAFGCPTFPDPQDDFNDTTVCQEVHDDDITDESPPGTS